MTKLFYVINGTKDGQLVRLVVERDHHKSSGSIDAVIERDKVEIEKLQKLVGWTDISVSYRGRTW